MLQRAARCSCHAPLPGTAQRHGLPSGSPRAARRFQRLYVADAFAPENHSEAAAALLAPYVDDETHWVIKHHGIFQGYYYFHHLGGDRDARDRYADSPHFDACVHFCAEYDQNCFDPNYDNMTVDDFRPMLDEVFARPSQVPGIAPLA